MLFIIFKLATLRACELCAGVQCKFDAKVTTFFWISQILCHFS